MAAPKHIYKRYCDDEDCRELYHPTGKFQKYCEDCKFKRRKENKVTTPELKTKVI